MDDVKIAEFRIEPGKPEDTFIGTFRLEDEQGIGPLTHWQAMLVGSTWLIERVSDGGNPVGAFSFRNDLNARILAYVDDAVTKAHREQVAAA